jgi:hypothetical protein
MEFTVMVDLTDIRSLTDFQRKTRQSIARLKKTGRPEVLTVKGQAEIVVQDAASYQRLLARAEEADRLMELKRSIAEYRGERTRDIEKALSGLEARHPTAAKKPAKAK